MKRRSLFSILIASFLLAPLIATALAASAPLSRSAQAEAILQARRALSAEYGLTPETIGLFHMELEQDGDMWTVQFYPIGFYPHPLGEYRVTLAPGNEPETHWSYDDIDPEIWQSGGLDNPVWGQIQLLKALEDRQAAVDALSRMDPAWVTEEPYMPEMPPGVESLREDESIWFGQTLRDAKPGPKDIPLEDAVAIAAQAIIEESSITAEEINTATVLVNIETATAEETAANVILADFRERDGGSSLWMFSFQFYFHGGGIAQDWGVVVDAGTGEILFTNIITGGNG